MLKDWFFFSQTWFWLPPRPEWHPHWGSNVWEQAAPSVRPGVHWQQNPLLAEWGGYFVINQSSRSGTNQLLAVLKFIHFDCTVPAFSAENSWGFLLFSYSLLKMGFALFLIFLQNIHPCTKDPLKGRKGKSDLMRRQRHLLYSGVRQDSWSHLEFTNYVESKIYK